MQRGMIMNIAIIISHDTRINKLGSEIFAENLGISLSYIDGIAVDIFRGFSYSNSSEVDRGVIFHNFKTFNIPFIGTYYSMFKMIKKLNYLENRKVFDWKILIGGGVGFIAKKIKNGKIAFYVIDFANKEYSKTKIVSNSLLTRIFYYLVERGEAIAINSASLVILITSYQLSEFSEMWPTKLDNGIFLPIGLDNEWYNKNENLINVKDEGLFIYIGAGERRILSLFIKSLQALKHKGYQISGIIIREKDEKVKNLLQSDPIDLKLYNDISTKQLMEFYSRSIALIIPSVREGFCLPIIEAGSQGTTTIASNLPQFRDLIENNQSGILIEGYSPENWLSAMEKLMLDKKFMERLSNGAKQKATDFKINDIAKTLYDKLKR